MLQALLLVALILAVAPAAAQTPVVRDNAGSTLGFYSGFPVPGGSTIISGRLKVISSSGYVATFVAASGLLDVNGTQTADGGLVSNPVMFKTLDCTGQGYVFTSGSPAYPIDGQLPMGGAVFRVSGTPGLYDIWYVPKSAVAYVPGAEASMFTRARLNEVCQPAGGVQPDSVLYPAFPNDPGITGIPNVPFTPPLRIDVAPVSAVLSIFRDSFESTQAAMPHRRLAAIA